MHPLSPGPSGNLFEVQGWASLHHISDYSATTSSMLGEWDLCENAEYVATVTAS